MAGKTRLAVAERERIFVEAYIANGGKGHLAAIQAGYSAKGQNATRQSVKLLKRPTVIAALRERQDRLAIKYELTTESVIAEIAKIALFDPGNLFDETGALLPIKKMPPQVRAAIASIEIEEIESGGKPIGRVKKIKIWDKNSALEKAMKHLGLFSEDNKQRAMVSIIDLCGRD